MSKKTTAELIALLYDDWKNSHNLEPLTVLEHLTTSAFEMLCQLLHMQGGYDG